MSGRAAFGGGRFRPFEVGEDHLLGFRLDPMNMPFIEMYRLEPG